VVADGGFFSVALPDFAHHPLIGTYEHTGYFTFTVSEHKSGKYVYSIKPEGSTGAHFGIPVVASYEGVLAFAREVEK